MKPKKLWTPAEDAVIRAAEGKRTATQLGFEFERSSGVVSKRARKLGVKLPKGVPVRFSRGGYHKDERSWDFSGLYAWSNS